MVLDLSADHAVIIADWGEAITLSSWGPAITDAYRLADTEMEGDPTEGGYLQRRTEWHLSTLQAYTPAVGNTITDADGVVWIVQTVREPEAGDFWGLTCLESSITDDVALEDRVWLHPGVDTLDAWGSKLTNHTAFDPAFADVPAKIMLRPSVAAEELGQRDFVERFDIYVARDIGQVHNGDVLKDGPGKQYTIVSYRNRNQIDELSVIECEDRISG